MSILIRVHHPGGRTRLTIAGSANFQQFQEEVQKTTGIPTYGQSLSFDEQGQQRVFGRPHATVEMVGLTNGCVVWVKGQAEAAASSVAVPMQTVGGSGTGTGATTPKPESVTSEGGGPKHKTFESFLRVRRFDVGTLSGNLSYRGVKRQLMTKMPPTVTLTHQAYRHVDHVEFMNVPEITNFVQYWQGSLHCITQRCGWMYGYYAEDNKSYDEGWRAVVEGIYEPPQKGMEEEAVAVESGEAAKELELVDKLMDVLGLERMGFIWTSRPRQALMTAKEAMMQAKRQLEMSTDEHYTGYRVSKQVGVVVKLEGDTGQAEPEAVMVSDQAMAMLRDDLVRVEDQVDYKETHVKIRASNEKEELLPSVLQEYKDVKEFDADWLVVKVNHSAPVKPRSFFKFSHFPRENRSNTLTGAASYFRQIPRGTPTWQQFSDFHLLLFIAKMIDFDTAAGIAASVRDKTEVADGFVELVKAALNQF
jgi:nuclear protein localization family protein 4